MSTFHYRALATDGKVRTGTLSSGDEAAAVRELRRQGMTPVFIGTSRPGGWSLKLPRFGRRRSRDLLHFTQEVSTLLDAGIPLDRALSITAELTERKHFRSVIDDVLRALRSGSSFADSLGARPEYFSELYLSMVRAGEVSGTLSLTMDRLAEFERSRDELRGYIISSLTYPGLLSIVGAGSIFVLLRFVIPKFAEAFTQSNIVMPTPMRMLLGVSDVVGVYGVPVIALLVLSVVGLRYYVKTPAGRLAWDRFQLRIPLLGAALRKADTARFARAMATLVQSAVPLVQSIRNCTWNLVEPHPLRRPGRGRPGRQARRRDRRAAAKDWAISAAGRTLTCRRRGDRQPRPDVRPHGGHLRQRHPRGGQAFYRACLSPS